LLTINYKNVNVFLSGDKGYYGEESIHRLIDALDSYIALPERDLDAPFLMPIDNLVSVPGRGTVAIGQDNFFWWVGGGGLL
jgi:translation elongation factor EF-Tu-like GTPase